MTTTTATPQSQHRRLPLVAAGATAAVIVGLGIAGVALTSGQDSTSPQAPTGLTAQDYSQYQHYYSGMTTSPEMTHGRHLTNFHYSVSGGRVQLGQ